MKFDYIIRNGHVVDTLCGVNRIKDIGVLNGRVHDADGGDTAKHPVIDAEGFYVLPGLIDFHTHIYDVGSGLGVNPDYFLATGVTATVDAGTSGASNYEAFHLTKVVPSYCKVKAQINITSQGQFQLGFPENYNPKYFREDLITNLLEKYPDEIIGLKMRLSKETVGDDGMEPFMKMLEIAEHLNLPVVIHTTNPAIDVDTLANSLRKGDVYCHCYQGEGDTILDKNSSVRQSIKVARKRGVIFDACNGTLNFAFAVTQRAIAEGFYPDVISSDTSRHSFAVPYFCKNLPFVMSKFIALGMDIESVVKAVTETPARLMGMGNRIGTLKSGACADIAILKLENKRIHFNDRKQDFWGDSIFVNMFTMLNGNVVYCANDFWL